MMIHSLRQHWPARKTEWIMAGWLGTWGVYVLLHPQLFTADSTRELWSGMTAITSEITQYPALAWGGAAFLTAVIRISALLVNGLYTRTPLIRLVTSFASMFIVTQVCVGLWKSGVSNTGLVVYPWLVVVDLLSTFRAAVDVAHAEKQRQDDRELRRADRSSSSYSSSSGRLAA